MALRNSSEGELLYRSVLLIGDASIVRSADHSDVTTFQIHFDTVILPEKKFHDVALVKSHQSDSEKMKIPDFY